MDQLKNRMDDIGDALVERDRVNAGAIKDLRGMLENARVKAQKESDSMRRDISRLSESGDELIKLTGKFAKAVADAELPCTFL